MLWIVYQEPFSFKEPSVMNQRRLGKAALALALLLGWGQCLVAAGKTEDDALALARRIDQRLGAVWAAHGVQPAPQADEGEFIRRVYLDLAGRIPSILEVRDFLDDDRPDKRQIWIGQLLAGDAYANHFANVWRSVLLSQGNAELARAVAPSFEIWLSQRLKDNAGYDQIVREILTAPVAGPSGQGPNLFYQVNEYKVENLAASTSRLFLGVKLECAQCHAHPFARWTRTQFWEYAALFAGVNNRQRYQPHLQGFKIPGTDKAVQARFLTGAAYEEKDGKPLDALARWMTLADNPYFARTTVNRVWAYFFGLGLIEPVDELDKEEPSVHRELLEELANQLTRHHYDLKFLIRAITASRAYQLTSRATHPSQDDPRLLGRMTVRAMTPEQLFDSLAEATEYKGDDPEMRRRLSRQLDPSSPRAKFLATFPNPDRRTDTQTTILQALFLMNGKFMADATNLERSKVLATIAETASIDTARRIETLYLVALARKPRPEETARLVAYVDKGGTSGNSKQALADVFWALLNSAEFILNH
jgi:hypothetical protein